LTTAFVKTKHNPAKLPPVTPHPMPSSHVNLASSVPPNTLSNRIINASSIRFQDRVSLLSVEGGFGREVGNSMVGDGRGEKEARERRSE
jgi:hypothetical protein